VSISPTKLEELIRRSGIFPRWVDGKRIIPVDELAGWLDSLPLDKP
jgi:hypothetical protein